MFLYEQGVSNKNLIESYWIKNNSTFWLHVGCMHVLTTAWILYWLLRDGKIT